MSEAGALTPGQAVGFVGLGRMGRPMAERLAGAGWALQLVDADPAAADAAAAATGGRALASVDALGAGLAAVILMLPDGAAVREVLVGRGLLGRLPRGCLVIDMGSCEPAGTAELAVQATALGLRMIDAPVSGGVARARTGELTIMVGGADEAVAAARPLLQAMGSRLYATGAIGSGQAMKSLNNFVSAAGLVATCEAVLIGRRFGLDPMVIADVLNGSTGRNNTTEHKLKPFILSRSWGSGFALDLMVKDLSIAASVARQTNTPTVLADRCLDLWREARGTLGPGRDHTEMARWLEQVMCADEPHEGDDHGKP